MHKKWEVPVYFCVDAEDREIALDKIDKLLMFNVPLGFDFIIQEPTEIVDEEE